MLSFPFETLFFIFFYKNFQVYRFLLPMNAHHTPHFSSTGQSGIGCEFYFQWIPDSIQMAPLDYIKNYATDYRYNRTSNRGSQLAKELYCKYRIVWSRCCPALLATLDHNLKKAKRLTHLFWILATHLCMTAAPVLKKCLIIIVNWRLDVVVCWTRKKWWARCQQTVDMTSIDKI